MNRFVFTLALIVFSAAANAGADYQCVNNCASKGF